jgi:exopolyphosphatase / guanosine-5'-triphosphate,3'-diphosphate pyrophosphatase
MNNDRSQNIKLRSSIDMGSNSVLLLIGKIEGEGLSEIVDQSRVTSLGKDLDLNKVFIQESMDKTYQALSDYKKIIEKHELKTSDTIITATEASRVAKNAKEFFNKIQNELGFNIKLISSEGEAFYTGKGISLGESETKEKIIIDLGGASTELIKISLNPFTIVCSISLPFGSVRAQDWIEKNTLNQNIKDILSKNDLSNYLHSRPLFVAGTMTSLACIMKSLTSFDASQINGQVFSLKEFNACIEEVTQVSCSELLARFPYLGKRANTVAAGGQVISSLARVIGVENLEISTLGLRHGTLFEGEINGRYIT